MPRTPCSFRLLVFDLDGTLVDSVRDLTAAVNHLIRERGGTPLDEDRVARMVGEGAKVTVRRALDAARLACDDDALARFLEIYDARLLDHTKPYEGIPDVLARASRAGLALAVLTNKPLAASRAVLEGTGLLPYFGALIVGGDGPWPRKPAPDGLLALIERAATNRSATLLVGDSTIDIETARSAGVPICLARYGFGTPGDAGGDLPQGSFAIDHPLQLAERLGLAS